MSNKADYDDVNTSMLAYVGILSVIVTFVLYAGLQALHYKYEDYNKTTKNNKKINSSDDILSEQAAQLDQYGWVNKKEGVAAISIQKAKEIVVREWTGPSGK